MTPDIIDIHPHIISTDTARYPIAPQHGHRSKWSATRPITFEQLIAEMDEAGVSKAAIVHSSTTYGTNNAYVADSVAQHPDRFTGVYSFDLLAPDALQTFDYWLARGMGGIRLFTGGATHQSDGSWLVNPATFPIWERCAGIGMTMAVQTTPEGLSMVAELAHRFPSVNIVLDHCGRPNLEAGPPYANCADLFALAAFPNVYMKITPRTFDLAQAAPGGAQPFFAKLVEVSGADHLAFGSNYPASAGPLKDLVAQGNDCFAGLSDDERAWIWGGTAKKLYPMLAG
ncbi:MULTISPECIES: amidohydrolase family protein [unclassified Caballeronia]|uniref:amidohydrolase family protein n=1 Tax=unclassified Caballeronia TaxID=2646786 RepID=UPI002865C256|nr:MULTISPECIES: amidohydrolase family protein [unclassified Caballeronia]MDR5815478.1 amidohydrolase family protein [Caballeronia sp. LZ033]MDR5822050.1 amidohydrolase family protein [Caballeronia sp. LZ043]MDR5880206.1 amidohydrolase family protein [Caballeronia sp. LZ032]